MSVARKVGARPRPDPEGGMNGSYLEAPEQKKKKMHLRFWNLPAHPLFFGLCLLSCRGRMPNKLLLEIFSPGILRSPEIVT